MNKLLNNSNKTLNKIICRDKYSLLLDCDGIVHECGKININLDENKMDENKDNNIEIISQIDSKWFNNEKIINIKCASCPSFGSDDITKSLQISIPLLLVFDQYDSSDNILVLLKKTFSAVGKIG